MNDQHYMQTALQLAAMATGKTNPNPLVGAVIVKEGRIIGFGAHLRAGQPHAEVHAFRMAGEAAEGATLYVTLEPCSHHGRTPPCADLVIRSNVQRVVVAMLDPNPLVAGRGVTRIREAGIEVEVGVLEAEAQKLNERFVHNMRAKRPFVMVKTAMTLDGKIAAHTGDSRWVTGSESRELVHRLRDHADGILVGIGTVLADDPELTTRLPEGGGEHPVRIVLDRTLRTPETARLTDTAEAKTWILTGPDVDESKAERLRARGVEVIPMPVAADGLDLAKVLDGLYERGITDLLVEGGAAVNGAFLQAGLIDKVISFIAPKLIGGAAPSPYGGTGFDKMAEAVELTALTVERFGDDLCLIGYPKRTEVV
ncbi:diaminohydroxyphosphoribosylaminopyrimidine deaminase/5-amino-6-(5-phosphoribosylamino)uracil reductase [Tumebacillus sp. BK434]|nr:diaminohydroxyphosphoribosylaminopyrimidine deaminase/5-amino-6-(5-phosphoribosylamino)uracil reductase [Tumebacillus sp. BK434]